MGLVTRAVLPLGLVMAGAAATWQLPQEPPVIAKVLPRTVLATVKGVEVFDARRGIFSPASRRSLAWAAPGRPRLAPTATSFIPNQAGSATALN